MLTRQQMEETIKAGGSVVYQGQIINSVDALPSEAVLAQGDADKEAQVAAAIDAQIAQLMAQRQQLRTQAGGDEAQSTTTTTSKASAPAKTKEAKADDAKADEKEPKT
jgi:hypothetical protein